MSDYTPEQIAENRAKWLAALRSEEYKQAAGCLVEIDQEGERRYCCLGVLEAVRGAEEARDDDLRPGFKAVTEQGDEYVERALLTRQGMEWIGVGQNGPELAGEGYYTTDDQDEEYTTHELTSLNDDYGLSFEEIADLIEQQGLR